MDSSKQSTLHLDALTASVALPDLAARGNDLAVLAQGVDEDWKRFGPPDSIPAGIERRHLITTMSNHQDCPPTGMTYWHTRFLQPGPIRAEDRDMKDRFLRGQPLVTAEVTRVDDGYRLETAILKMGPHLTVLLDWARGHAIFYVLKGRLPDTIMTAVTGRRIGDMVNIGHCEDLIVQEAYVPGVEELRGVLGTIILYPTMGIRTELPDWTSVNFTPIYEHQA